MIFCTICLFSRHFHNLNQITLKCLLKGEKKKAKLKNSYEHSFILLFLSYCFFKCQFSEVNHLHYKMPVVRLTVHAIQSTTSTGATYTPNFVRDG